MNKFGGDWTKIKIEILVDYAKAYLTIMNKQPWAKTLYFDGFAGSDGGCSGNNNNVWVTIPEVIDYRNSCGVGIIKVTKEKHKRSLSG